MHTSFTVDNASRLAAQIRAAEGLRLEAYQCPSGALTVGYGHNCNAAPVPGVSRPGDRITLTKAISLFESDLAAAVWNTRRALPWVAHLTPPRQAVLYDMAFNMGLGIPGKSGLLSFSNTLRLIENANYHAAARAMLASKWARQVKNRATRLAHQMLTGEWQ